MTDTPMTKVLWECSNECGAKKLLRCELNHEAEAEAEAQTTHELEGCPLVGTTDEPNEVRNMADEVVYRGSGGQQSFAEIEPEEWLQGALAASRAHLDELLDIKRNTQEAINAQRRRVEGLERSVHVWESMKKRDNPDE